MIRILNLPFFHQHSNDLLEGTLTHSKSCPNGLRRWLVAIRQKSTALFEHLKNHWCVGHNRLIPLRTQWKWNLAILSDLLRVSVIFLVEFSMTAKHSPWKNWVSDFFCREIISRLWIDQQEILLYNLSYIFIRIRPSRASLAESVPDEISEKFSFPSVESDNRYSFFAWYHWR